MPVTGQPQISRENLQPMVAVTGRIEGRGIGAAVADVKQVLTKPGMLAPGVGYNWAGCTSSSRSPSPGWRGCSPRRWSPNSSCCCSSTNGSGCRSSSSAARCCRRPPSSPALWLTGVELNITALMGMTMIIGIGTEMAIFYVSEYAELAHAMPPRRALREASRNRLRPITMTTLAAHPDPAAAGAGDRPGLGDPAAAGDRDHRRPAAAIPAGFIDHANSYRADLAKDLSGSSEQNIA